MIRPLVIIESPYAGDVARNVKYARLALCDSIARGEAPIAFHLVYPETLAPEGTVRVPLTRGYSTIIDEADSERVGSFKWFASGREGAVYAARHQRTGGSRQDTILLHRFLTGCPSGMEVDHINGDRLDNRRINLRICEHQENGRNTRRRTDNTSGFKGVSPEKGGKWRANIRIEGRQVYLGTFVDPEKAARAYDAAAVAAYGRFARTNFASGGVLSDGIPDERALGIELGLAWRLAARRAAFYIDLGWSVGMDAARSIYEREAIPFDVRRIYYP